MDEDIKKTLEEARKLAADVRANFPAEILVQWHMAIVMGHEPALADDGAGDVKVVWPESGGGADSNRRDASLKWLAERGHGDATPNPPIDAERGGK